jgi:hypothetical protein
MAETAFILLTYRDLPSFGPGGYARFLVEEDNPFFNSIPGIARYENWRVEASSGALPGFEWFDLMWLDPGALEAVWFNPELTRFRRGWVARWGYGGAPAPVNANGWLFTGAGPMQPAARRIGIAAGAGGWALSAVLPKHYAMPEDAPPVPWRRPAEAGALGAARLSLVNDPGGVPDGGAWALTGTRVAPA